MPCSPVDLTGRWIGHYMQRDREYPITADLVQVGEALSGSMRDGHPDRESSVFEVVAEAGLPPGADEQIEAKLREMVPQARTAPIRFVSHLPADSILAGRRHGQTVSFLKTYKGTSFSGYKVGDQLIGTPHASHVVHYEGQLDLDRLVLEGRWWIDADPAQGMPQTAGSFTLRRREGDPVPVLHELDRSASPTGSSSVPGPPSVLLVDRQIPAELPPAPTEPEEELYQQTCTVFQEPETPAAVAKPWVWLVGTLLLFVLSFLGSFPIQTLLLILGVLFLHESGHFLGMRVFGYRNLRMFFIPFFGAAVSGRRHAAPVWQRAVVLLLGPLPGIALGLLLVVLLRPPSDSAAGQLVFWLIFLNAFNLLPLVPLDGGALIDLLLFARQPWLAVGFRGFAVAGLVALAWWGSAWILAFLGGLMLLGLPLRYQKAKRERAFRGNPLELPEQLEQLDDRHQRELFGWVRLLNPLSRSPRSLAADMRNLHECMVSRHPGLWGRSGLLLVYGSGIAAAVAAFVLVRLDDARLARAADELTKAFAPTVDAVQGLRQRAEQQEKAAAPNPDRADVLRAEAVRLRAEADEQWSRLVATWREQPQPVQLRSLFQVVQTEDVRSRLPAIQQLGAELGIPVQVQEVAPD